MALGVDLENRDMVSSAQTDVELMLAANVGLEHSHRHQTSDVVSRAFGSTRDRPSERFVLVLRSESCGFDEQRRARAGSWDGGLSGDRV